MQFRYPPAFLPVPMDYKPPTPQPTRFAGKTDFPADAYDRWKTKSPEDETDRQNRQMDRIEAAEEEAIRRGEEAYKRGER